MATPYLTVDLDKIEHNTRTVVATCARAGITVTGVTKATCGAPEVAAAMVRGGVVGIGDSRIENVRRMREAGIDVPMMMLRIPPLSAVDDVVSVVELSANSELAVIRGLAEAALARGAVHDVIVMVDLGDLREGVWPDDLVAFVGEVLGLAGVRLAGIGANLTCYGGVIPTAHNMGRLVSCAEELERTFGISLDWISGGNSSALPLVASGHMPARVNNLRVGEAILLGRETIHRTPWPGTFQDAIRLHVEVIEHKEKPSMPIGPRGEDAFGTLREFEDRGEMTRVLVNVGHEDVEIAGLEPRDGRIGVLGGSSDYTVVDVTAAPGGFAVGDEIEFTLRYGALLAAMDSEYVHKRYVRESTA